MRAIGLASSLAILALVGCGGATAPEGPHEGSLDGLRAPRPNPPPSRPAPCVVTGCSSHVCADSHVATTCEWREEYACYGQFGVCERDAAGQCGWRQTPELTQCIAGAQPTDPGPDPEPEPQPGFCAVVLCAPDTYCDEAAQACLPNLCALPQEVGPCRALIPRWWHNPATNQCEFFNYGGCQGNANNFETQADCEATCHVPSQPPPPPDCRPTGCSGQVCADTDVVTTCEWREEYACYQRFGVCERGADGACGWRETRQLNACIEAATQPPPADCRPTGCSGQVCADTDVITTCEWRPEYACYQNATCERAADGSCGWRQTRELAACLGGS